MRKTLFALLGLVAVGMWAVPVLASTANNGPPKAFAPIPLENRAGAIGAMAKSGNYQGAAKYQATLSGTLIKQASATTTWFLYPGACTDRITSTWVAKTVIQADSLNGYTDGFIDPQAPAQGNYTRSDLSSGEKLWHIVDSGVTPANQRPAIPTGTHALWCGKYDAAFVNPVGYPNLTAQILYIDLEANRPTASPAPGTGTYTITMKFNSSTEQNYDFVYFMGGGGNLEDPIGNDRAIFDALRATGSSGTATLQATFTGSIIATTPGLLPFVNGSTAPTLTGEGGADPATVNLNFHMTTDNRALDLLMTADCLYSGEDGLWPFGHGVILDDITVSDDLGLAGSTNRVIYAEQNAAGGTEPLPLGGNILLNSTASFDGDGKMMVARVYQGKGELWTIQSGNNYQTSDVCNDQKNLSTDKFFLGVSAATKKATPDQFNAVVSCTFPVPAGTADITALWGEYLNLPRVAGYVQYAEYRSFKGGSWTNWDNTAAGGGVRTSVIDQWVVDGDPLAQSVQADSFQVRYDLQCIPAFSTNNACDANTQYAVLYDDLFIQVTTGVPAPVFGVFVGSVAQSTFVDGTLTGLNCATAPCWPGIRGTDLQLSTNIDVQRAAVKDNFNAPLGDTITASFVTGLRKNGMGINWHRGFIKSVNGGLTIAVDNGAFVPNGSVIPGSSPPVTSKGAPMVIYRLYDPATDSWSPWDSSEVDANNVQVNTSPADTIVIDSEYRMNWPPRDKQGSNLPGTFTINGIAQYNNLKFLPKGVRLQYYWKATDINGGIAYQFSTDAFAREVEDLPTLPGGTVAPDIIEFDVLPRHYPLGNAASLLAASHATRVLNLDGNYTGWSFGQDPVTQAIRGLGVRADRYRFLQGLGEANNIGGHVLTGRDERGSNYFPNKNEYGIVGLLISSYDIIIQNSHLRTPTVIAEQDASVLNDWAKTPNGTNAGDRCLFMSGDDGFNALVNGVDPQGNPAALQAALSLDLFGVANVTTLAAGGAKGAWAGAGQAAFAYPTIDDRFAAPGSGPGLAAPGSFTYETDAGCPGPNRFDPLTAQSLGGLTTATASATYPLAAGVTDVASVMTVGEWDGSSDFDKTKSLAYGFSIQYVRGAPGAVPRNAANYVHSGVQNRMQILYKFLTGCRGAHSGAFCWPCPTDANMTGNWAVLAGFNTGTYGPLLPIQDFTTATGVEVEEASAAPRVNRLDGNAPNPFNPLTKINLSVAQAGKVTIRIYNVAGQLVRTLETKVETPGAASILWDGKNDRRMTAPSGVYFYKATFADGKTLAAKTGMTLLK